MKVILRYVFVCSIPLLLLSIPMNSFGEEVIFICNKSVNKNEVTHYEIKKIFLGVKKKWTGGQELKVSVLIKDNVHKVFAKKYTNRTFKQFKNTWRQLYFTGKGTIPKYLKSSESMLQYIANTEGAIGFLSGQTEVPNDKIKILSIK